MRKGARTREAIVNRAAQLFSVKGFCGTSIDDLVEAIGMSKGAIYSHFQGKEDIFYAVLEKAGRMIQDKVGPFVNAEDHACDRLLAMIKGYRAYAEDRVFDGGCLILNSAVEVDDVHDGFRLKIGERLTSWRRWVVGIVEKGKARGEVKIEVDAEELATLILSSIMGAMVQYKTFSDLRFFDQTYRFFQSYLASQVRA
jgi:TetR/AcrR family transcriptional repressor of nem operon